MAGAGYKLFATGDVLTAQQVNEYLQQQVIMVFASSTARTTALSGVLAEGMVSYLKDTNATEVYDGSAWIAIGNSGDITGVTAGTGLTGGGASGSVTLNLDVPVSATNGGTAQSTYTTGDILYASASNTLSKLAVGSTGQVLTVASGVPSWAAAGGSSKVVQIVTATYSTQVDTSSATYSDTGLTASITPTSASNKVLVFVNQAGIAKDTNNTYVNLKLKRGTTDISNMDLSAGYTGTTTSNRVGSSSLVYLDSPATTSSTTYKTQFNSGPGSANATVQVNSSVSSICLMEVTP